MALFGGSKLIKNYTLSNLYNFPSNDVLPKDSDIMLQNERL